MIKLLALAALAVVMMISAVFVHVIVGEALVPRPAKQEATEPTLMSWPQPFVSLTANGRSPKPSSAEHTLRRYRHRYQARY